LAVNHERTPGDDLFDRRRRLSLVTRGHRPHREPVLPPCATRRCDDDEPTRFNVLDPLALGAGWAPSRPSGGAGAFPSTTARWLGAEGQPSTRCVPARPLRGRIGNRLLVPRAPPPGATSPDRCGRTSGCSTGRAAPTRTERARRHLRRRDRGPLRPAGRTWAPQQRGGHKVVVWALRQGRLPPPPCRFAFWCPVGPASSWWQKAPHGRFTPPSLARLSPARPSLPAELATISGMTLVGFLLARRWSVYAEHRAPCPRRNKRAPPHGPHRSIARRSGPLRLARLPRLPRPVTGGGLDAARPAAHGPTRWAAWTFVSRAAGALHPLLRDGARPLPEGGPRCVPWRRRLLPEHVVPGSTPSPSSVSGQNSLGPRWAPCRPLPCIGVGRLPWGRRVSWWSPSSTPHFARRPPSSASSPGLHSTTVKSTVCPSGKPGCLGGRNPTGGLCTHYLVEGSTDRAAKGAEPGGHGEPTGPDRYPLCEGAPPVFARQLERLEPTPLNTRWHEALCPARACA